VTAADAVAASSGWIGAACAVAAFWCRRDALQAALLAVGLSALAVHFLWLAAPASAAGHAVGC